MFNTKTQEGFETTRAIFAFLADRYSGKNHNSNYAKISNWILGNEINNQIWNYMGPADLNTYVSTYQQAFRTFYTAIKSTSANDRVYFSLDFWWGAPYENLNDQVHYTGKGIVDTFNALAVTEGQMDWGIAYHRIRTMTEPEFWDDPDNGAGNRECRFTDCQLCKSACTDRLSESGFDEDSIWRGAPCHSDGGRIYCTESDARRCVGYPGGGICIFLLYRGQ